MPEDEQVLHDELEKMVTQELTAKAMDDVLRQAFEEEKRKIASQKKAAQATRTNTLSTDRPSVSTDRPFVSTDRSNTPYVSTASTPTGANAGESSFVYLGGKIPFDVSTLPNANLPINPNMSDLEDSSNTLPNDEIFNGAYDDDEDVGAVADFNNMDNTIVVSPIPTLRIHKAHPKGQILGDPILAVQTRGKIQKVFSTQQALKNPRLYYKPYKMKAGLKQCKRNCFSSNNKRFGYLLICHMGKRVIVIQDEGRTSSVMLEEKESANEGVKNCTDNTKVSTDRQGEGTADQNEEKSVTQTYTLTPTPTIPTPTTPTPTIFGDDETIAQVLIIMSQNKEKLKEKEKGVEIRNVEETERPRPTSTRSINKTLRPLPKIDPKE
ncbi:hypothetical protein Tco_0545885 [Tanacetum coccineum]